jgi:hypothetical protein
VAARADLVERGVDGSEVRHLDSGTWVTGPDPERRDYSSFADFSDPDGNTWGSCRSAGGPSCGDDREGVIVGAGVAVMLCQERRAVGRRLIGGRKPVFRPPFLADAQQTYRWNPSVAGAGGKPPYSSAKIHAQPV